MFDFLSQKFSSIFSRLTGRLTPENVEETLTKLQDALLEADVPYDVVQTFMAEVRKDTPKTSEMLIKQVHDKMTTFLGGNEPVFNFQLPSVVMMIGLQGSGKTTSIAKLASMVKQKSKKRHIFVGSVDFYRPAAIDQLEKLAQQVDIEFYRSPLEDPVAAAQDIIKKGQAAGAELIFLDTAGRLHVDNQMLEELQKIDALVRPKYKFLVIDAMIGQESLNVARAFQDTIGFTGAIVSKMDSEARGGVTFAFRYAMKKPIFFVGTGEKVADLEPLRPDRMASRIIGMGDLQTLIEKADATIKKEEQDAMAKSFTSGKMTLEDFEKQLGMVDKLGSLSSIMKYMPGMGSLTMTPEMLEKGELEMKMFKAIIRSMTRKERVFPKILDASRKKRIALGAGVSVSDINSLLTRFEQSQQFANLMKKNMGNNRFFKG